MTSGTRLLELQIHYDIARPNPKRKFYIFQPSIFQGRKWWVSGRVWQLNWPLRRSFVLKQKNHHPSGTCPVRCPIAVIGWDLQNCKIHPQAQVSFIYVYMLHVIELLIDHNHIVSCYIIFQLFILYIKHLISCLYLQYLHSQGLFKAHSSSPYENNIKDLLDPRWSNQV